jgi:hypothetical protein
MLSTGIIDGISKILTRDWGNIGWALIFCKVQTNLSGMHGLHITNKDFYYNKGIMVSVHTVLLPMPQFTLEKQHEAFYSQTPT